MMNATTFTIGSPQWKQALSDIRELLGESEMPEAKVRNLVAFDIPTLLTKLVKTINPAITVLDCLPTWNNRVVVKFPAVKSETDNATIEAIMLRTLQLSKRLNIFNPEICYIITREVKDNMMLITLTKEIE